MGWRAWTAAMLLAALGACGRSPVPERSAPRDAGTPRAAPAASAPLPDGELSAEPAPGGRKPSPPMPGQGAGLPVAADAGVAAAASPPGGSPPPPLPTGEAVEGDDSAPPVAAGGTVVPAAAVPGAPAAAGPTDPEEAASEVPGLASAPPAGEVQAEGLPPVEMFAAGSLTLKRLVLCKGVAAREPVEPTDTFQRDRQGQIWVYVEAANTGAAVDVTVTFESLDRPGAAAPPVKLEIGNGPRWRTWAWATAWRPAGRYAAVVRDGAGAVLARGVFQVVGD